MPTARAHVVSSFTIIKGALIAETYRVFELWDFDLGRFENLRRIKEENLLGAASANWLRDVAKVINRRFDFAGRDKPWWRSQRLAVRDRSGNLCSCGT